MLYVRNARRNCQPYMWVFTRLSADNWWVWLTVSDIGRAGIVRRMRNLRRAEPATEINRRRTVAFDTKDRANRIGRIDWQVFQNHARPRLLELHRLTRAEQGYAAHTALKSIDRKLLPRPAPREKI